LERLDVSCNHHGRFANGVNDQFLICQAGQLLDVHAALVCHHRSSRMPLKNGCRTFPSADFARYSISASNDGSAQTPRCAIFLA
jgi:hypothetical protein